MISPNDIPPELLETHNDCEGDSCGGHLWPKAYATLKVDMRLMTGEQKTAFERGLAYLRDAGINMDTGVGGGWYDMELDWSLRGASLNVRPLRCSNQGCELSQGLSATHLGLKVAYWSLYRRNTDGWQSAFPYCSEACRAVGDGEHTAHATVRSCDHPRTTDTPDDCCDAPIVYAGPGAEVIIHDVVDAWKIER